MLKRIGIVLAAALVAAAGCNKQATAPRERKPVNYTWAPPKADTVAGVPASAITASLGTMLGGKPPAGVDGDVWAHVKRLYKGYDGAPLWMESSGPNKTRTGALLTSLVDAHDDGLRLDAYPLDQLSSSLQAVRDAKPPTADQLAQADVYLSAAYLALAEDLLSGQTNPKEMNKDWHIDAGHEQVDSAVVESLKADDLSAGIDRMRPEDPDYDGLREALKKMRAVVDSGGWPEVPAGPMLKKGDRAPAARLAALRTRLRVEGFDPGEDDSTSAVYSANLADAVNAWQAHHGIAADGVLGEETVKQMNVPADYRLGQVAASLERHRWLPRSLGQRYIYVNVPAFHLEAHDSSGVALEMKVIVGQEYEGKSTPVFADSMEEVVFRPYWLITPDIQAKEIGPKVAADPSYLDANDMEYYKDGGETRIRQRPGPKNSLGLVKFLFPNSYNIYLHDTPSRMLFLKDTRAFSHGCIRLEKPAELAQWVLGWDAGRVDEAMNDGPNNTEVHLKHKIPVYITYFTAYTQNGELYFGNDLYSRDEQIVAAMKDGALTTAQTRQSIGEIQKLVTE